MLLTDSGCNASSHLQDNRNLDGMGFAPFAKVVEGMDIVDKIYSGYGEKPDQGMIQSDGNKYLKRQFPNLSYIEGAYVVVSTGGKGTERREGWKRAEFLA